MNGELFKEDQPPNYRFHDTCVSFEDEDFDVSIIVVATKARIDTV
jgi:hypothetical protein